jgi:primase-polymerase (primpol)-like protein
MIPAELKALRQWVCWRTVIRDGEPTKKPVQPGGTAADSTAPRTWHSYESCVKAAHRFDGIGFVFSEQDQYSGIDLDGCRNPETGTTEVWAQEIVNALDIYWEVSASKTGLHGLMIATLPAGRNKWWIGPPLHGKDQMVELYDRKRYFATTGEHVKGILNKADLEPIVQKLSKVYPRGAAPIEVAGGCKVAGGSMSEETAKLIGLISFVLRTRDHRKIEYEFMSRFPAHYAEQNRKHGTRGGLTYIGYSIQRLVK